MENWSMVPAMAQAPHAPNFRTPNIDFFEGEYIRLINNSQFNNRSLMFNQMENYSLMANIMALLLIIIVCKIIYVGMIFMLKVLKISEIREYIQK